MSEAERPGGAVQQAGDYVAGYSIFNDASIRDYQFKSPQWTEGKNFDDTGAGTAPPVYLRRRRGCRGIDAVIAELDQQAREFGLFGKGRQEWAASA